MKNKLKIIHLFVIVLALATFSCRDDDNQVSLVTLQDLEVTIDENPTDGQVIGTIMSDGVGVGFSITSQTPSGALDIDSGTGEVSVADASLFDFEANSAITATISADNAENPASVTISVTNVNEVTTQSLEVTIDENPTNGQVLGTLQTTGSGALNFSIMSQSPDGALSVDASSGELTVADASLFDFEVNPTLTATVTADDSEPAAITVNLNNVNELTVQDFSVDIDENPANGLSLGTVEADGDATLSFSISSQTPTGALSIDASTGELTVEDETLFDYETNSEITATISVDNSGNVQSLTATVNLNNINEVGDYSYGGVIFWVDAADNNHGLVCSTSEQGNAPWGCSGTDVTAANGTAITTGKANTDAMAAACVEAGSLAITALNLTLNGYSDWFVPSKDELYEIYLNRETINAVLTANGDEIYSNSYWTSTQFNTTNGWFGSFSNGFQGGTGKHGEIKYRVIREFDFGN